MAPLSRKSFLHRLSAAGLSLAPLGALAMPDPPVRKPSATQPPFLQAGDLVGITCPASPVEAKDMEKTRTLLSRWGLDVCVGRTVGNVWQRFAGTDPERAADLQLMINDPQVKAILFARGGYGAMRIMDKIDWSPLLRHPKWLVGYSDITAFHCHVHTNLGLASIHGNMAASFRDQEDNGTKTIRELLTGVPVCHEAAAHDKNRIGSAKGVLVGGNLSLVAAMLGSRSDLNTDGKILFLEEVNEFKYTLDRLMMMLKRAGKLENLAALMVGGITATRPDQEYSFPMTEEEIIAEKVADKTYPVCFRFPSGHFRNNLALKMGVLHQLVVSDVGVTLQEQPATGPTGTK